MLIRNYIKTKYNINDISLNKINNDFIYKFLKFILLNTDCTQRPVYD